MTQEQLPKLEFDHEDFEFATMEDELRVDERCQELLHAFYLYLQAAGMETQLASDLAYCADYYLRDYLLDFARQNVVRPQPGIVSRFAATWFITRTLDPEIGALDQHLRAIGEFYRFLHKTHYISAEELAVIEDEAGRLDYYRQRIADFIAIKGEGYVAWEAECPLKADSQQGR